MNGFAGFNSGLGDLWRLSSSVTRSISAENPTGEKGKGGAATEGTGANAARDLGQGWKVSPSIHIASGEVATLADIEGAGAIQHIWLTTHTNNWRKLVLRFYWDGDSSPAVEVPVGDFFGQGWGKFAQLSSLPVAVNPHGGFNCYWPMPFKSAARITLENLGDDQMTVYFQVDYALSEGAAAAEDVAYFHAQWRRSNPLQYKDVHTIVDGVSGSGHYVGTYLAWGVNSSGWWGEGEIKYFLDGDEEFPTICGTGTEDYFGGAWNFDVPGNGYTAFTTPFLGLHQVLRPDGLYQSQQRFGMYRWHIFDPIRFATDLKVNIQALGWRNDGRYLSLQDDIASTAFLYGKETSYPQPEFPGRDHLEIK